MKTPAVRTHVGQLRAALKEKEAAAYIGMSIPFLRQSRTEGDRRDRTPGPPFIRVGRAILYLKADLDAWLAAHRVERKAG